MVWAIPMVALAKRFAVSDNALRRWLLRRDIELPGKQARSAIDLGRVAKLPMLTISRAFETVERDVPANFDWQVIAQDKAYVKLYAEFAEARPHFTAITRWDLYLLRWAVPRAELMEMLSLEKGTLAWYFGENDIPAPPSGYFTATGYAPGSRRAPLSSGEHDKTLFDIPGHLPIAQITSTVPPLEDSVLSEALGPDAAMLVADWYAADAPAQLYYPHSVVVRTFEIMGFAHADCATLIASLIAAKPQTSVVNDLKRAFPDIEKASTIAGCLTRLALFARQSAKLRAEHDALVASAAVTPILSPRVANRAAEVDTVPIDGVPTPETAQSIAVVSTADREEKSFGIIEVVAIAWSLPPRQLARFFAQPAAAVEAVLRSRGVPMPSADDWLVTDGVVHPRRYPDLTQEQRAARITLSVPKSFDFAAISARPDVQAGLTALNAHSPLDQPVSRLQLYRILWLHRVSVVLERLGVNRDALLAACRRHNVPMPRTGTRRKDRYGSPVVLAPLPAGENVVVLYVAPSVNLTELCGGVPTGPLKISLLGQAVETVRKKDRELMPGAARQPVYRSQLFRIMWHHGASVVVQLLGIPKADLIGTCQRHDIPMRQPGIVRRAADGAPLPLVPLPAGTDETVLWIPADRNLAELVGPTPEGHLLASLEGREVTSKRVVRRKTAELMDRPLLRFELYHLLWLYPLKHVAAVLDIDTAALQAICVQFNIPQRQRSSSPLAQDGTRIVLAPLPEGENVEVARVHISKDVDALLGSEPRGALFESMHGRAPWRKFEPPSPRRTQLRRIGFGSDMVVLIDTWGVFSPLVISAMFDDLAVGLRLLGVFGAQWQTAQAAFSGVLRKTELLRRFSKEAIELRAAARAADAVYGLIQFSKAHVLAVEAALAEQANAIPHLDGDLYAPAPENLPDPVATTSGPSAVASLHNATLVNSGAENIVAQTRATVPGTQHRNDGTPGSVMEAMGDHTSGDAEVDWLAMRDRALFELLDQQHEVEFACLHELRDEDLDLDRQVIKVKNGLAAAPTEVPVSDASRASLLSYLSERPKSASGHLFLNLKGAPLSRKGVYAIVKRILDKRRQQPVPNA